MYQDNQNEYGCPLLNQRGADGVRDFHAIIAQLSPPLRAAFEVERVTREHELERMRAAELAPARDRASGAIAASLLPGLRRLCSRESQSRMSRQIASYLPHPTAQQICRCGAQATSTVRDTLIRAIVRVRSAHHSRLRMN